MPQDQPPEPLIERLAERHRAAAYALGVMRRDALRAVQARLAFTTPALWIAIGLGLFGVLFWIWHPGHPSPAEHWAVWLVGWMFIVASLSFFVVHAETRIKERREAPHGGDRDSAQ